VEKKGCFAVSGYLLGGVMGGTQENIKGELSIAKVRKNRNFLSKS